MDKTALIDVQKLKDLVKERKVVIIAESFEELNALANCTSDQIKPNKKSHWDVQAYPIKCVHLTKDLDEWFMGSQKYYEGLGYKLIPFRDVLMDMSL